MLIEISGIISGIYSALYVMEFYICAIIRALAKELVFNLKSGLYNNYFYK